MGDWLKTLARRAETPAGTRIGGLLCIGGAVLSVAAGAVGAAFVASRPDFGWLTAISLFTLSLFGGMAAAQMFYALEGLFEQRARDLNAADLMAALRSGGPVPRFVLYLRPFASTDAIADTDTHVIHAGDPAMVTAATERLEFEAQIERAVRPIGQLVALGAPLEHEGAGRILTSEDRWRDEAAALMDAATLIILLPSPNAGTLWEVDQLVGTDRMRKTIVIDPPNAASERPDYDPAAEWSNIEREFAFRGYTLPPDARQGQLVYFGGATEPKRTARLSLDGVRRVRRFVRRVMADAAAG